MRRQQAVYLEPVSTFADIQSGAIADIHQSIQAMVLPRLDIMESLGIGRMADAFGAANVYQSLGLGSDYDTQMRAITSSLSGHMEAVTAAQALRDTMFPSGLTDAIACGVFWAVTLLGILSRRTCLQAWLSRSIVAPLQLLNYSAPLHLSNVAFDEFFLLRRLRYRHCRFGRII
jgi:hypothetical protein